MVTCQITERVVAEDWNSGLLDSRGCLSTVDFTPPPTSQAWQRGSRAFEVRRSGRKPRGAWDPGLLVLPASPGLLLCWVGGWAGRVPLRQQHSLEACEKLCLSFKIEATPGKPGCPV